MFVSILVFPLASPASAEGGQYTLTVAWEMSDEVRQVTLDCDPVGGTHPDARAACAAIEEAGSIEDAEGEGGACPRVYDPVRVLVEGDEDYSDRFVNHCVLVAEKGVVFDF